MTQLPAVFELAAEDRAALERAVRRLENPSFAARLANRSGRPINRVLARLPRMANDRFARLVRSAIMRGLTVAIESLEEENPPPPAPLFSSVVAGVTGGLSGLFGMASLPVELPLTTTLMLRAIADIARHEGEDLTDIEARLACLEVFGLGSGRRGPHIDLSYYATRALLSRYTNALGALVLEKGVTTAAAPAANSFVREIATRFGLVVSDKVAAGAVPVLGAIGGATINVVFMDHFQRIAQGHFTVRRLERRYGSDRVRQAYADLAGGLALPGKGRR
jgi:hypothetical protein